METIMLEKLNAMAYQYNISTHDKIKFICEPLTFLGIKYFSYLKIFSDGSYLSLLNNLDFQKAYFSSIVDSGSFFNNKIESCYIDHLYCCFIPDNITEFNKKTDPILYLFNDFNIKNIFSMYKLDVTGYIEIYSFMRNKNDTLINSFYLSNLHLLKRFIDYFKEKAKDIIEIEDKTILAHYLSHPPLSSRSYDNINVDKIKTYIEKTKLSNTILGKEKSYITLTNRELECLHYLALGNSIKATANQLNLSPRTIETHLNNCKIKTGYYTKNLLIKNFIKNDPLLFINNVIGQT